MNVRARMRKRAPHDDEGKMATYKDVQDDIKRRHGRTVKTCWIAHVKELTGLQPRKAANRISAAKRKVPCPPEFRPIIESSMRRLGLLG